MLFIISKFKQFIKNAHLFCLNYKLITFLLTLPHNFTLNTMKSPLTKRLLQTIENASPVRASSRVIELR